MEKNSSIVVAFRYMWLVKGDKRLHIHCVVGQSDVHDDFIEKLKNDENIIQACRVYMHEIDLSLLEEYETVKEKEVEDNA